MPDTLQKLPYDAVLLGAHAHTAAPCFPYEFARNEANKCLLCKNPQCQKGCPIHTDIPGVIRLFREGKANEAGKKLFENNPLTTVCCVVCDHAAQCEGHCVQKNNPVHFSAIENYLSSSYALCMTNGPAPQNGISTAVIGAGPAGLTIAVILARYGYDVTIFDRRSEIGGILRYAIPDYRLPRAILDDFYYRHIVLKQIHFRPNTCIGSSLTVDDLFRDGFKSVFLGAGLWKSKPLGIPGESLANVIYSLDYLENPAVFNVGKCCAIIGVGNSAMDCARTAKRSGAFSVTCFARRGGVTASEEETACARAEGVEFSFCHAPVEIKPDGVVFRRTECQPDGSFKQIEGSEELYLCNSVILCTGQMPRAALLETTCDLETDGRGLIFADESGQTSRPGVFSAGDAVSGARTVVEAVAQAKIVAERMHKYMQILSYTGTQKAVADILRRHFKIRGALLPESRFERDIIAHDLSDYTAFVADLQNEFGIQIDETELRWESWDTFGKISAEIEHRLTIKKSA